MSARQSPPAAGHDRAAELLSALLDGELDETTAAAVTAHRQECAECSRDWAELRATKQLLAALPAAQAPRSYAILADDLGAPDRAGATFWPRLLGLTWRLSGALAVVIILIGTMQLAGISLGEEAETQFMQAEPQAAVPARAPGELGAAEAPAAQQTAAPAAARLPRGQAGAAGAADAASQAIVVERERPVVVEKVVEKAVTVEKAVVVEKVVEKQVVAADAAQALVPSATATLAPSPAATATIPPTATAAPPTAVPTPAPAALAAAPQREPVGPTFAPGVLWLIGGAMVVVVAGAAWLGERWVRGRLG